MVMISNVRTCLDPITEVSSTQALLTGMILFSDCTLLTRYVELQF